MSYCRNCGLEFDGRFCPECGTEYVPVRVCINCGTEFTGNFCPECGTLYPGLRICRSCGREVSGRFCTNCGARYVETAETPSGSDSAQRLQREDGIIDRDMWSEGLDFRVREESYAVRGIGLCDDTALVIPAEHDGKPVTLIDWEALSWLASVKSVTFTGGVN